MNFETKHFTTLAKNQTSIVPVAFHFKQGMAYFGDYQEHKIMRVAINGSLEPETILDQFKGVHDPYGLAVDWINDWIYWSSPHHRTISMAKLDGTYSRVIVNESLKLDEPRGVAVDPLRGYLFWADWGIVSHIGRAAMDGSNQQLFVTDNLVWPNGIAVDIITQYVYWVDGKLEKVEVIDYYGRNRKVLVE
jgi:DNA-binding beta-propeller fold protein YncE